MTEEELRIQIAAAKEICLGKTESLERLLNERDIAQMKALDLQARKYDDLFAILNKEIERLHQVQTACVSREIYDRDHKEHDKEIGGLREFRANMVGRQAILTAVIAATISLIGILVSIFVD